MFGDSRAVNSQPRRKQKRRKNRVERCSSMRYEQLEQRLTLSSNPTLSIPTTLVGARGGVVNVPIDVNQLTDNLSGSLISAVTGRGNSPTDPAALAYVNCTRAGLSSADFAVDFDPNVFSVSKSDVRLGTIPSNVIAFLPFSLQPNANPTPIGWTLTVTFSTANPGQMLIHIAASDKYANITSTTATSTPTAVSDTAFAFPTSKATGPVVGSIDSLVTIDFHVRPGAALGKTQINLASGNAAGTRPTEMFDATGRKYTLGPAPTNGSADIGVDGTLNVIPTPPTLGTWTAVTPSPFFPPPPADIGPVGLGTMLQLPDGSIMVNSGLDQALPFWFKLTPDATGNYANGTWTRLADMDIGRLFFGSVVLQDGRVMVLGGEYTGPPTAQTETPTGAIYDPATDTWTPITSFPQPLFNPNIQSQNPPPAQEFGDGQLELMNDGTVLAGFLGYVYGTTHSPTFRYDPVANLWTQDATLLNSDKANEESWVKLPDGSMLAYQVFGTDPGSAERLVFGDTPADDRWVPAGHVPVNLMTNTTVHAELGSANLLPDGRVFYLGATNNTALYTPPSPGNPNGSWAAGPNIPFGLGANDCPAAVMPDGRVLFQAGPTPVFGTGSVLFEYDPVTNSITPVNNLPPALAASLADPASPSGAGGFNGRMLVLPNGQILLNDSTNQAYVYTPAGGPQDSWRPTISDIEQTEIKLDPVTLANINVYTLTGIQLNGLSEGAVYGDDAQMATNYPIIELVNKAGNVVFATTSNWSSAWVATGSTPESVDFTLPAGTTLNDYVSLRVIANGISSFPTNQTITLGAATAGSVIIRVDPGNAGLVDIVNAATNVTLTTHPNNSNWGTINIVGDASNNVVTIDESNGI
ncbi:MAG TPA: hypothetical protein VGY55_12775, partial [Pirellulales bacterium]|nr:hypothetical protein [Pirellulales bacterium]